MAPRASTGRERLEKVLVGLGRPSDRSARSRTASVPGTPVRKDRGADQERLVELSRRLERIERKLTDMADPVDGIPDRFDRWIAEGHWEHVTFSEFLRLKK